MWKRPLSHRDLIPRYEPVYRDVRLSRCESCHRVFTNKDDLKHHIALTHTGRKPYACVICGKRYGQVHHLNSHFKLHKEPRLQEFAILKHRNKPLSEPPSPLDTTVGSFKVPKALKSYVSEPTYKSYGTLQSFTITSLNTPEPNFETNTSKLLHRNIKLPDPYVNEFVSGVGNSSEDNSESESRKSTHTRISLLKPRKVLPNIKSKGKKLIRNDKEKTNCVEPIQDVEHVKDYWVDTKSEWQTIRSSKHSEGYGTLTSFSEPSKSLFSEPISFKASTPKPSKFLDKPDYLCRGMSGIRRISGYDPVDYQYNTRNNRHKSSANTKTTEASFFGPNIFD